MNILITGATGFIGSHLLEALTAAGGHTVYALVRNRRKWESLPYRDTAVVLEGDLLQCPDLPADIEVVFHLAALTKAPGAAQFQAVNEHGTRALLHKVRGLPRLRKLVVVSTLAAAGPAAADRPLQEEDPPAPISQYGRSKLEEEAVLQETPDLPCIIVRAPVVFGERDMDMLYALRSLRWGVVLSPGTTAGRYSVVYVKDLVRGMMAAAFSDVRGEIFYITHPEPVHWPDFMRQAAQAMGRDGLRVVRVPMPLVAALGALAEGFGRLRGRAVIFNRDKARELRHPYWTCSGEKSRRLLGFTASTPTVEALSATVAWYRAQGLL